MIDIQKQHKADLEYYFDKLVQAGETLSQCKQINVKCTSVDYKTMCMERAERNIKEVKQKIFDKIIYLSQSKFLDMNGF